MEAIFYSSIAGAASIMGVLLVVRWQDWTIAHSHFVNSLAAGVILGVAFFSLMPEALGMSRHALLFILAGFMALYVIETAVVFHSGVEIHFDDKDDHGHSSRAWTVFTGLFLHSLIDGVVIGIGFEVSHELGMLVAVSVILHELPEGATTFALLINRITQRSAFMLSIAVGVATPLGALVGLAALPAMGHGTLGAMLALAAGSFIYVGASDLVPETHTRKGWINAIFIIAGAALAYLLSNTMRQH